MTKGEFPQGEPFAVRVKRLREEQGLTIALLAKECDASESAIRSLETGSVKAPSLPVGLRLAKALHVDPYYLALGDAGSVVARIMECAEILTWAVSDLKARVTRLEQRR